MPTRIRHGSARRSAVRSAARVAAFVLIAGLGAGCDDFLKTTNPGAIDPDNLNDPAYLSLMVNGVVGEFQNAFSVLAYRTGVFTDELHNHHTWWEEGQIDQRLTTPDNATMAVFMYNPLHRARFLADTVATRLQAVLADSAGRDLRLARVRAYGGFNYVQLGEYWCESPLNMSRPYTSEELLAIALERFDDAIGVATAARAHAAAIQPATAASQRTVAGADSILNLARVGAARASLNLYGFSRNAAHRQQALQYASQVASGFDFRAWYSENTAAENTEFSRRVMVAPSWASLLGTPFLAMAGDPRIPRPDAPRAVVGGGVQFVPNSPASFSSYSGTAAGAAFTRAGSIRFASHLEAQYVRAELEGLNAANLEFVNARRAVGGQAPLVSPSAAEYLDALRDQRRRDLYLTGHRLGDLRRYKRLYNVDEFPTGPYPGSSTVVYGDAECFPVTLAELNGNPHYR